MGVACMSGSSFIYEDNTSVIHKMQHPDLTLKKNKSNSISFHAIWVAEAMQECISCNLSTRNNPSNILCKNIIAGGYKKDHLIGLLFPGIMDHNWKSHSRMSMGYNGFPPCWWFLWLYLHVIV